MRRNPKVIKIFIVVFIAIFVTGLVSWFALIRVVSGIHHKAITKELYDMGLHFKSIDNGTEADHAVGMLRYIENYYVPGPGYQSTSKIELELELQRRQTLRTIVEALEEYSGQSLGSDPNAWEKWKLGN